MRLLSIIHISISIEGNQNISLNCYKFLKLINGKIILAWEASLTRGHIKAVS